MTDRPALRVLLAATAGAAVVLAGCGGVRTGTSVQQGLSVAARPRVPVRVVPLPPQEGASPEQIVRGFLRAGVGVEDDERAVARGYFVRDSLTAWRVDAGLWVYPDETALKFTAGPDGRLDVSARVVATIDRDGRLTQLGQGTTRRARFHLRQVGGQWRIADLPADFGLWLSSSDLQRVYSPFEIGYVAAGAKVLVPDVRWFPVSSALTTTLARAQLGGVPRYLAGVVGTGVPAATRLDPSAVPVVGGIAAVSLSGAALTATAEQRQALAAQFFATLVQVPQVNGIALTAGGTPLDVAGAPVVTSLEQLGYAAAPATTAAAVVVRREDTLSWQDRSVLLDADRFQRSTTSPGVALPKVPIGWTRLAVSREGTDVAAVSGDGAELARWRGGQSWRISGFATGLRRPAYDGAGGLWVAGRVGDRPAVFVLPVNDDLRKAMPKRVVADWLAGRTVITLRVARDDLRAAILSTDARGQDLRLDVTGIVRDRSGSPQRLTPPMRLGQVLTTATDLCWVDSTTIAVVGRSSAAESLRPYLVRLDGTATALAAVPGARTVTTSGGERGLLIGSDDGRISARVGNSWQDLGVASGVVLPGD
ncbi:MAG TPA: LpqB family beta-propeller domain-containing protein [Dermatophilaceae bacterium]|nr:LpqB family beta-propeller domain-containing protein [Dermatophilaceae bacterium]